MHGKKTESKFTIQFSQTDPAHIHVTDILNKQERHGKARYIVEAVTHYLSCDGARQPVRVDEKHIEAVVSRIMRDWRESGAGNMIASVPADKIDSSLSTSDHADKITYNDAMDALGEDGYDAITSALDTFRRK